MRKLLPWLKNHKSPLVTFLFLSLISTLYAPFRWGEEKLKTEDERRRYGDYLPIEKRNFIWGDSKGRIPYRYWEERTIYYKYSDLERYSKPPNEIISTYSETDEYNTERKYVHYRCPLYTTVSRQLATEALILNYLVLLLICITWYVLIKGPKPS